MTAQIGVTIFLWFQVLSLLRETSFMDMVAMVPDSKQLGNLKLATCYTDLRHLTFLLSLDISHRTKPQYLRKNEPGSKRLTYSLPQPCITTTSSHKASQAVISSHKSPPSTISLHNASASSSLVTLSKVTQQGVGSASSSRQGAENRTNIFQTPHVIIQEESSRPEVMTIPAQLGGHCDLRSSLLDNSLSSSLAKFRKSRRFISKRARFKKSKM